MGRRIAVDLGAVQWLLLDRLVPFLEEFQQTGEELQLARAARPRQRAALLPRSRADALRTRDPW